jgi:hypothetical protein
VEQYSDYLFSLPKRKQNLLVIEQNKLKNGNNIHIIYLFI